MRIQRALPCPEDIGPFAAGELANELPTATRAPHDLFDRNALVEKIADEGIGVLATQVSFGCTSTRPFGLRRQTAASNA